MSKPGRGLHETLVTEALAAELARLAARWIPLRSPLEAEDAADRLSWHLARVAERALRDMDEDRRVPEGLAMVRRLVEMLASLPGGEPLKGEVPVELDTVLTRIVGRLPDGRPEELEAPLIPLLDTALLTNAPGEPRVGSQLAAEIPSADRIDVVMAFIRRTGIGPLLGRLQAHHDAGRPMRVLTTTYTGSTEATALDGLRGAGADVRVSYDTTGTRLHAKAWLFHRDSGFSTAYIGSSNLTHSAQFTGLEWNVRVSGARNPAVVEKMGAVFESYWNSGEFEPYDPRQFRERTRSEDARPGYFLSPLEIRLEPFQERLLEQVALARAAGRHWNLLVSATGTGKTVMAAMDYARLRGSLPRARLLFVAHREEILRQSMGTFRHALRDPGFGEAWVGGARPSRFEQVFASIQSLASSGLGHLAPDHFDVVIVDEFHHAAAASYRRLLDHVRPRELLGLTATPERADGESILPWFHGRIAAELRLWDAIDQHRLVPFQYFGIYDGLDLTSVTWVRGRGYDVEGLTRLYTGHDAWARLVVQEVTRRVDDPRRMRALGFCVGVDHARFMARWFNDLGIPSRAVWSDTPEDERHDALEGLRERRLNAVFSVDLFNEGVDVPSVDTLILLRPTDSPTLFLQQLGRGLRRHAGKAACTVLDFVGLHRAEFRFDRRLGALLGGGRRDIERQVEGGFPFLPAGCHMELDAKASEIVLHNLRKSVPAQWTRKVEELKRWAAEVPRATLAGFLHASGLELEDVYQGGKSWSDLLEAAGLDTLPAGPCEAVLRRGLGRMLHVDDVRRLDAYQGLASCLDGPGTAGVDAMDRRWLRMWLGLLMTREVGRGMDLAGACALLGRHPQVLAEARELLDALRTRVSHLGIVEGDPASEPLVVHGRYTRAEILAAMDVGDGVLARPWQSGVEKVEARRADLLAFTLDKTRGGFSPNTRYKDHAISRELIHWESQSRTREDSETGRRYRGHAATGWGILLFAQHRKSDGAYYFLGPATYVRHEGEMPMAVTWRLRHALPGDLFASFAAAVA